ncbi:beta-glucosidase [Cordyceps fumosorosea ARSEF 2679]|uniref:beta-glucosidase n=1 Tax=Cordyceps fumosorosea (strain ARSEF 2679) TaxID=1081104 RepID=A0A167QKI7_CORFA|nr:beta-glucosidase [Cordyceps fumosorosea ARSEF 2679]OAA57724.1 beta-glucosidase [Cordyceps fumosorosea ARSEF 2679]
MVAGSALWAATAGLAIAAAASGDAIVNDAHFYGQSPPVYPSRNRLRGLILVTANMTATGGAWADAHAKARDLVSRMTLAEKVSLTGGAPVNNGCSGNVAAIPRLGFPGMCLSDAGQGLRATDFVSSFPSGIHVGASWNKDLAARRGAAMADEFKKKGVNVLLGPVVGPAWRVALGGRNWEGFAADPYLSGSLAAQSVVGIQGQGVITSVKHYIGNEQETNRNPSGDVQAVSSNIDDRTMHEMYLWPFQDAVHAGSGNIMCSYQRINNSYGCANSKTLNGLLKTELGFQGFVVSDWGAQHTGYAGALAGMDMAMPDPGSFWGDKLVESVKNGSVPESRIDDMATRILTPWYQFNQDKDFPNPGSGMPKDITKPHVIVDARDPAASSVLFDGAIEGHVLVKNTNSTLPLLRPRLLSVFGYSAKTPDLFAPGGGVLQTYQWQLGAETIDPGAAFSAAALGDPSGAGTNAPSIGINGTLFSGCGSGATTPALAISPLDALTARAHRDGTALLIDLASPRPVAHPASDACLVFGNAFACEAYDRPGLQDAHTDALVNAVADSCARTVVVLHNAGPRLLEGFVDHPNVTAVLLAHLPGQASGPALAALLYGDAAPSGKLPYTLAKNGGDYPALRPSAPDERLRNFPQSNFSEGVLTDYRHFDRANITPRFEFGFGLSYATFAVSGLTVQRVAVRGSATAPLDEFPSGAVIPGGHADLWDNVALATAEVRNTGGERAGAEVVQLYVGIPDDDDGTPARQLRGYEKMSLQPGEVATVTFALSRRDLSVWDVGAQRWRLRRGTYRIEVGTSSRDLPLQASLEI